MCYRDIYTYALRFHYGKYCRKFIKMRLQQQVYDKLQNNIKL